MGRLRPHRTFVQRCPLAVDLTAFSFCSMPCQGADRSLKRRRTHATPHEPCPLLDLRPHSTAVLLSISQVVLSPTRALWRCAVTNTSHRRRSQMSDRAPLRNDSACAHINHQASQNVKSGLKSGSTSTAHSASCHRQRAQGGSGPTRDRGSRSSACACGVDCWVWHGILYSTSHRVTNTQL